MVGLCAALTKIYHTHQFSLQPVQVQLSLFNVSTSVSLCWLIRGQNSQSELLCNGRSIGRSVRLRVASKHLLMT